MSPWNDHRTAAHPTRSREWHGYQRITTIALLLVKCTTCFSTLHPPNHHPSSFNSRGCNRCCGPYPTWHSTLSHPILPLWPGNPKRPPSRQEPPPPPEPPPHNQHHHHSTRSIPFGYWGRSPAPYNIPIRRR